MAETCRLLDREAQTAPLRFQSLQSCAGNPIFTDSMLALIGHGLQPLAGILPRIDDVSLLVETVLTPEFLCVPADMRS